MPYNINYFYFLINVIEDYSYMEILGNDGMLYFIVGNSIINEH